MKTIARHGIVRRLMGVLFLLLALVPMRGAVAFAADAISAKLVVFTAKWCPHCRTMKPIVDKLAKSFQVEEIDFDANKELASRYKVTTLPTFIVYRTSADGEMKESIRFLGETNESVLRGALVKERGKKK